MNNPSMELSVTTLGDLSNRTADLFSSATGSGEVIPLTPLRLASYLTNPRGRRDDPVLFELRLDNRLVAYRTLLPDCYFDRAGEARRFAWFSGNYVDPEFRRQGLSTRLLKKAEEAWEGNLAYTNYAPASKAVYDRTGEYPLWLLRPGKRFYLRSSAGELLRKRLGRRSLLERGDRLFNRLREPLLNRQVPPLPAPDQLDIETVDLHGEASGKPLNQLLGKEQLELIGHTQQESLFGRDIREFDWILQHPWVTGDPLMPALPYPFSYRADRFGNHLITFCRVTGGERGLMWVVTHNSGCTVPYLFHTHTGLLAPMTAMLVRLMITEGCAYLTLRDQGLLKQLAGFRRVFLTIRDMPQRFFARQKLAETLSRLGPAGNMGPGSGNQVQSSGGKQVHDGDGDVVFTG